jgi:hypothetical protein
MLDFRQVKKKSTGLDWQPVHLRGSILVDVEMSKQSNPTFDHGEGLGDDDGTSPQSRGPMPLLGSVSTGLRDPP